jgi:hypothetical protein
VAYLIRLLELDEAVVHRLGLARERNYGRICSDLCICGYRSGRRNVTARPKERTAVMTFFSAAAKDVKASTTCAASASEKVVRAAMLRATG